MPRLLTRTKSGREPEFADARNVKLGYQLVTEATGITVLYDGQGNRTVLLDPTAASITYTLPSADAAIGLMFHVKRTTGGANNAIIVPRSGSIDGAASINLVAQYDARHIQSDGSTYWVL